MVVSSTLPSLETERLRALQGYGVLDTAPEDAFDELAALAAQVCGTPIALVSFIDRDRQWFKAHYGLMLAETPRDASFCTYAIGQPNELLIVPDVTLDSRFAHHLLVTSDPSLRFYAGVPLCTPGGFAIGTLSVMDRRPRTLSPDQQQALRMLGRQVMAQLELRRSLHEASRSQTRLENSQRIAGLGDWEYDFVALRLIWSEEVYRILGVPRKDFPPNSENFYARVHPDDLAFVHREKKAAAEGLRRVDFEHRIIRADGEVRHIHQIAEMVFDEHGQPIRELGTIQDITERKLGSEALRQSEERYRELLMLSPDAHFAHVDGLITFVNRAFCQLVGATRAAQLLGQPALSVVHPDFQELAREQQQKVLNAQPALLAEMNFLRLDGTTVAVEANALAFDFRGHREVQVVARDISARKRIETALRESEERFRLVARAVSDAVWDRNLLADTLWWNEGFLTTFGFAAGEIEPSVASWIARIHPDERSRVAESIRHALDAGVESWSAEYRFQRQDGRYASVQDRAYILRDATGKGVRMVGGMRDLTEQKKMEAQYLRSQRMESIGTLAGGISHDLNNVLAPIMMAIELLRADPANNPVRVRILETIYVSCCRGADLVRQVLSFARGFDGQRLAVQLRHVIDELEKIIRETFPRNIRIAFEFPDRLWPITGDPTQLHQVLLNLTVNARDAMPHGGTLTLIARNITLDAQYAATSPEAKAGAYVLLQVTDTGVGIPPEVRERIFEPFFTTKEPGKGTGFGLATVHTVVKSHGGFLTVESDVGRGTTFKIYLPTDPALKTADTAHHPNDHLPRGRNELVLVVDDEFAIRQITERTLQTFGYRVVTASDGADAVAVYARQAEQIAVVLTDIMMPVMDGTAAMQALRRINPSVKIIAVSGLAAPEHIARATGGSVHDFLPKPFSAQTLLRLVREVIDRPAPVASR